MTQNYFEQQQHINWLMKVVCKTMGCLLPAESHQMIELGECSSRWKKQWIRRIATISQQSIFSGKPDTAKTDDFFHIVWGAGSLYTGKLKAGPCQQVEL